MGDGVRLTDEQRLDWLRLIRSDNIGPRTFRDLVNRFGGAAAALDALPALARRGGARRPGRTCSHDEGVTEMKAAQARGIAPVALGEPHYPQRLTKIDDAPPLLAVQGEPAILNRPLIAVVGSRNVSAAGVKFTQGLARELGQAQFGVVPRPAPTAMDDLVRPPGAKPGILRTGLLELEIAARLERHGGGLVSLV